MLKYFFGLTVFFFACQQSTPPNLSVPISSEIKPKQIETKNDNRTIVSAKYQFPWLEDYDANDMLINRVSPPNGFEFEAVAANSFAEWLQHLPLKKGKSSVYLYNGQLKSNQEAHHAVFDIDVGKRDLQQCADAVIRLRAEYLFEKQQFKQIHFNFTSGDRANYLQWKNGYRPIVKGNKVSWHKKTGINASYTNFRKYLTKVFQFAGTHSLQKELKQVDELKYIQAGDVLIQGGFPGHAVLVMAVARAKQGTEKRFLLAQSYMPAQEIHLLKNLQKAKLSPWYSVQMLDDIYTPEWTFKQKDLRRF